MSLVLWSGGCDSTLLLHRVASEQATKKDPVRALSIVHSQVPANKEQAQARRNILKEFKSRGLHVVHSTLHVKTTGTFFVKGGGNTQGVLWLGTAISYLFKDEDLYAGYIRGDDYWHYEGWLQEAFKNLKHATYRKGKLLTPFEWKSKGEVIKELKAKKLLHLTWYCEDPKKNGKACGGCHSCEVHRAGVWQMKKEMLPRLNTVPRRRKK